jgi:hypothetical protein
VEVHEILLDQRHGRGGHQAHRLRLALHVTNDLGEPLDALVDLGVGPNIPRRATRIPVALATIACSNEILVPSANDVTM